MEVMRTASFRAPRSGPRPNRPGALAGFASPEAVSRLGGLFGWRPSLDSSVQTQVETTASSESRKLTKKIHNSQFQSPTRRIYLRATPRRPTPNPETFPMNRTIETLLIALALCGIYSAVPKTTTPDHTAVKTQEAVIVADGSDPMPLCRAKGCGPNK